MEPGVPRDDESDYDVLVLGGGLVGLAAAIEFRRHGFRTLLIESRGVGWGASGRSARLMDAAPSCVAWPASLARNRLWRERAELARRARHVVRPTPVALPLERGEGAAWARRARASVGRHRRAARGSAWPSPLRLDGEQRSVLAPGFRFGDEPSTGAIYGAVVEDQRLAELRALEARRSGATLLLRSELVSIASSAREGRARVTIRDGLDGRLLEAEIRALVDATGAWSSRTLESLGAGAGSRPDAPRLVGATLAWRVDAALRFPHPRDGRAVRVAPALGGMVVAAAADARAVSPAEEPPNEVERAWLDEAIADAFPALESVRRLYWSAALSPAAARLPASLRAPRPVEGVPLLSLSSPALASDGRVARLACARLLRELGREPAAARVRTPGHLPGGDIASVAGSEAAARATGLEPLQARWLVLRYGSLWEGVVDRPEDREALGPGGIPLAGEIRWLVEREDLRTLADLLRSWRLPEIARGAGDETRIARSAVETLAALAGWTEARRERELTRWRRERARILDGFEGAS